MQGKIIVIDGLDGSGKGTQTKLLYDKLQADGVKVKKVSFPDYDSNSSALVKMYLQGEISSSLSEVNGYAASTFYAADRYISYKKNWEKDYNNGAIILADRYTTSNAIYQLTKIEENEKDDYLKWLYDYEYNKLQIPKPDYVIYLDVPIEVSQKLISDRYNGNESKKDIHEKDVSFLDRCRKQAKIVADKWDWDIIDCTNGTDLRSIEDIQNEINKKIEDFLQK